MHAPVAAAAPVEALGSSSGSTRPFDQLVSGPDPMNAQVGRGSTFPGASPPAAPQAAGPSCAADSLRAPPSPRADGMRIEVVDGSRRATQLVERVQRAQGALDRILTLASSGRDFSPAELLALQAITYRAGSELELAGKLVEKTTSAVKQTLQTQL